MREKSYRRGEVEWALWQLFASNRPAGGRSVVGRSVVGRSGGRSEGGPPAKFLTRIKWLLDLDREKAFAELEAVTGERYAFYDDAPQGHGVEVGYRPYAVFALAVALDLLDAGFKQAEVVYLLRGARGKLARVYRQIWKCPPVPAEQVPAEDHPGCPSFEAQGLRLGDCRVFMLVQKVEMTEVLPAGRRRHEPLFTC